MLARAVVATLLAAAACAPRTTEVSGDALVTGGAAVVAVLVAALFDRRGHQRLDAKMDDLHLIVKNGHALAAELRRRRKP